LIRSLAGATAVLAGASVHAGPALSPVVPSIGRALRITMRQDEPDGIALTFDDGPHPQGTPAVLEALRHADAPATFFLAGEQVAAHPSLAAEIVAAGHRVELHCFRHRNQLRLTPRQLLEDAERARGVIELATGQAIHDYRPPYGIFSSAGLRAIRRRGWRPVLWSRWGRDWDRNASADSIVRRSTAGASGGDILLLHDSDSYSASGSWAHTAAAVPRILEEFAARGLRPVPLRR
jgi:peptidoglycan/xylan/chitin deacetylase (PgdA/CDA1 family)